MRPEPTPLDLKALEAEFYARPDHAHLKSLQTLHSEAHQLLCRTLHELRAFVMAKDDEVRIDLIEIQAGKCISDWFALLLSTHAHSSSSAHFF